MFRDIRTVEGITGPREERQFYRKVVDGLNHMFSLLEEHGDHEAADLVDEALRIFTGETEPKV